MNDHLFSSDHLEMNREVDSLLGRYDDDDDDNEDDDGYERVMIMAMTI